MRSGVTCVVPARLGSTRFFGKLLTPLFGKPLIVHTLERAVGAACFDRVVCATDAPEIGEAAAAHGFDWVLTEDAANGTERIARALDLPALRDAALIVNLQGDEPAFPEDGLRALAASLAAEPAAVHLLVHDEEPSAEDLANPNRVKTAVGADGIVQGFFRDIGRRVPPGISIQPASSGPLDDRAVYRGADVPACRLQYGAYGYSRAYLERYAALPPSADEIALSHEMLRAFGLAPIRAHALRTTRHGASVDVPDDLPPARAALENLLRDAATRPARMTASEAPEIFTTQKTQPSLQGETA